MNKINKKNFLDKKKSDTVVVYGCGYSINDLTEEDVKQLSQFDGTSFNWFCKSKIPTTFYHLREQATSRAFALKGETEPVLRSHLRNEYKDSCLIISDLKSSSPRWRSINSHSLTRHNSKFEHDGLIFDEKFAKKEFKEFKDGWGERGRRCRIISEKMMEYDLFKDGIIYDFCTLTSVMHVVTYLGYKRIIFVGVDLYDHRYFWLPRNGLRMVTRIMDRKLNDKHFVAKYTCTFTKEYAAVTGKELYTFNPRSLLAESIPVFEKPWQ